MLSADYHLVVFVVCDRIMELMHGIDRQSSHEPAKPPNKKSDIYSLVCFFNIKIIIIIFRVVGHTGGLQSSSSVAKYSTVATGALQVPLEAILLFHIDVAVLAPLSRCE